MQVDTLFEKGTGTMNEDFHFTSKNLFGVFDGATSLCSRVYEKGYTGGFLASTIAGKTFEQNNDTLENLAVKANAAIKEAMVKRGVSLTDKRASWSTSAAVIRLKDETFEWVQIGDCLVLVIFEDGRHEVLTETFDQDLETLLLWKQVAVKTQKPIGSALKDQILKVRNRKNITYGSFSGEKKALSFVQSGTRHLSGVEHILMFTDGLFVPKTDPETRGDFSLLAHLFLKGGLACIRDFIRRLEKTDPGCRKYPRFKPHDDIAAISLSF